MAYQSLYRRYRPQKFAEVRGQDHLVRALRNAVIEGRVGHAYLLSGPRGTGKTSTARILGKVLNCIDVVDGEPCGVCDSCIAIEEGRSFDVHELDAASNNGVDAIRDLINRASMGSPGRTKVYILDEVHMLSMAASNALLKTLEEPPDHVVFVLATTDPEKVMATIRSRTQQFEVHLLSADELRKLAEYIVDDAGLEVTPESIEYVVRAGAGSARDMESALDQVVAAGGITDDLDAVNELVAALCERDTGRALIAVDGAINAGRSPRVLGERLIARLRDVFLSAMNADLSRLSDEDRKQVADQAGRIGPAGVTRALEVLGTAFTGIQDAPDPRVVLEVALVRLTKPEADHSLEAIVERLERLEHGLGPLGSPPPPAPHQTVHPHVDPAEVTTARADEHDADPGADSGPDLADEGDAPDPGPGPGPVVSGAGAANAAREVLAARKGAAGAAPKRPAAAPPRSAPAAETSPPPRRGGAPASAARPATAPAAASGPASGAPAAAPAPDPASPQTGPPPAPGGALPTLLELERAWTGTIKESLPRKIRTRFDAGTFLEVGADGRVRYGLPNQHYVGRCEELRPEVEAALSAHFGVPVPLLIVVDGDAQAPPVRGAASVRPPVEQDEAVDLSSLTDADVGATDSVERIAQVFPGAELVDDIDR